MEEHSNMLVAGCAQTRNIEVNAPFEYCEWGPDFKKCKAWFAENWQQAFPEVEEDGLAELMTKLGFEGELDANTKKAQVPTPLAAATPVR
ncbi:MAG: hypothetical protein SGPRY_001780, partial [Prymnesium sp.]